MTPPTPDPRSTPIPLFCGTEIEAPDAWWDAHSPASVPFLPIPLSGTPARPRRWLGGRDGVVGTVVVPLETRYFDSADAAALGLRGGPGCGCTVDGVGCAICGNPLGTVTTSPHPIGIYAALDERRDPLHIPPHRSITTISTQQTFQVSVPNADWTCSGYSPRSPSPLRSPDAGSPGAQPPPLIAASPIPEDEQELGWRGLLPRYDSTGSVGEHNQYRTAPGMSSFSLSLPAATMDSWLKPLPYIGPAPLYPCLKPHPLPPESTQHLPLHLPLHLVSGVPPPHARTLESDSIAIGLRVRVRRAPVPGLRSLQPTPPNFPSVSEQEAWLAAGSSSSGTHGGEVGTTRRRRASVPYLREPLLWGAEQEGQEQEGRVEPMDVDSEAQVQGSVEADTTADGAVLTVTMNAGGGSVHVVDGEQETER
ncbi:hypothetical protein FB45DRAFT_1035988 [Roridomyces roridus]|uniref:Uncharacterized protein n=1 Tax=Roridomyces roridus TaxID=1738132 RepID=A0AAD7B9W3_9AGAR|nr:hypothetical protein FB45DRAFT_1035988 [Roridomyces roridus]